MPLVAAFVYNSFWVGSCTGGLRGESYWRKQNSAQGRTDAPAISTDSVPPAAGKNTTGDLAFRLRRPVLQRHASD